MLVSEQWQREIPKAGCHFTATFKQICINVRGAGLRVDEVTGELERLGRFMHFECNIQVNAFGTLANGTNYSQTAPADCGTHSTWVRFNPRTDFRNGSLICARARQGDSAWTDPACLTIKA